MASAQCPKPTTNIEVCQPKSQHGSLGQKLSEMASKTFKVHHGAPRYGSGQNQQTLVESLDQNISKTEEHSYAQTQTKQENRHGVTKTQIKVTVVEAEITSYENPDSYPYGTTTSCFGSHALKNGDVNKDRNLFQRIKNRMSHHNNEGNNSSDSESDSDDEKRQKGKVSDKKCPKNKQSDVKCPQTKSSDEKCPKYKN